MPRVPRLSKLIVRLLPLVPRWVVRRIASRYIAGESREDLLRAVSRLHARGVLSTVDVLGENVRSEKEAASAAEEYVRVVEELAKKRLPTQISVKASLVGLRLGEETAAMHLERIAERAAARGISVALDMEDATTTDAILRLYRRLRERYEDVGVAVQAYLRRSVEDLKALLPLRPAIRVCKGIYVEPPGVTIEDRREIRESFLHLVRLLLEGGGFAAIATHDPWVVDRCLSSVRELGKGPEHHEFQMLLGVGESLRGRIRRAGSALRLYCPYGPNWYAYSVRRLQENPHMAGYVAKSLCSFHTLRRAAW